MARGMRGISNGNIYEGDFKDGKAHGNGVFNWAGQTHETYDGQWANGLK
jgi:hypothetical protein